MEGILLLPPDRGTIIGRAMWKPRFVVVGPQKRWEQPSSIPGRTTMPKDSQPILNFLTIYKSKTDSEPIQQHAIASLTECQVQVIAHKKQGQVAPTLVITVAPDPATDKLRKRRSSRATGLTSSKEPSANILYFRTGDETLSLQDWERYIQTQMHRLSGPPYGSVPMSPMSPMMSPTSPTFTNPFVGSSRSRDPSDYFPRPPSGATSGSQSQYNRAVVLSHKNSTQTYSSRERPMTYSGSPSLRSKRSDISSHASFMNHSHHQSYTQHAGSHYNSGHPTDLPSPAHTVPEHGVEFIEGWTAAQGRASTINSPGRGRGSISSQVASSITAHAPATPSAAAIEASSPPGPRETILDRAFQMRCIPGSEMAVPGEEKLSSLARFEALMREMDKKRETREEEECKRARQQKQQQQQSEAPKSGWDQDDDSSEDESDLDEYHGVSDVATRHPAGLQRGHSYSHSQASQMSGFSHEMHLDDEGIVIPPGAQRALDFIATGRSSPAIQSPRSVTSPRSPLEYSHGFDNMIPSMNNHASFYQDPLEQPGLGNQTMYRRHDIAEGHASRPHLSQGMHQQNLTSSGTAAPTDHMSSMPASRLGSLSRRNTSEKRHSASSLKRISFTEQLTRRLSSTSSLLLHTGHDKSAAGRASNDGEASQSSQGPRSATSHPRGAVSPSHAPPGPMEREWEKKCGWRGSVVVSNEGGFL